ncbi:hypothetical protein [Methylobacter sp.]|uniref:hypothetical protein n=1 Tax=Methylobacter sp. TaxID=2051955 RepID=UPI002489D30F|nr:hypothetical protein [Methylobacter sp.]MDI1279272.1 hypothetical protein [Methylobacter sp.]
MREIPSCDSSETLKGLELRIKNLPEAQKNNIQFIGIKNASQQRFDEQQGVRECSATLITSGGEQLIPYTLSFSDQQNTVKPNDFSTGWVYFGASLLFCAAWILMWRTIKKTQAHKKNQTSPLQSKEPKQTMKNFELLMAFIAATLNKMPDDWGKYREWKL